MFESQEKKKWRPEDDWLGMPEFCQKDKKPYAEFIVRVRNAEDFEKMIELMNQTITLKTKSIWYPALLSGLTSGWRYESES